MVVTALGMITDVRAVCLNALAPMVVTASGMVTDVMLVIPLNAFVPI
jgi:hypothetical protein